MPPRPDSVSPALGKTSPLMTTRTAYPISCGDIGSKLATGSMIHHPVQIYDYCNAGMMPSKYSASTAALHSVDAAPSNGQLVHPMLYQPVSMMSPVNCPSTANLPMFVPSNHAPYIVTPPLIGTTPQQAYPGIQLAQQQQQQQSRPPINGGSMLPVSCGVSKGSSDWTAASEPRPQYYIPGGGSTQYVILYDPTLTNQIMMNPVTTGGTSSGSLKAIAPAPSTLNQQPEMILSEPQYITQSAPRVMPGGPFAAPSYTYISAIPMPYPMPSCDVTTFATRQYTPPHPQPTCYSLINAQANPLMNSANMDVVWHGNFDECFRTFYPHVWQLSPSEEGLDDREYCRFNDSAKVRFLCQSCCNAWTSMKGRVVFWFKLDVQRQCGSVFFKLFGQKCQKCLPEQFEHAMWYPEEVIKVVMNLHQKVGQTCYGFQLIATRGDRRPGKPRTQHNSHLCQACAGGICREGSSAANRGGESLALVKAHPSALSA